MPKNAPQITTEADALLTLIQQKGEISLEDAAKQLGISVKTAESYANFFEEEGVVGIKYKFTTPYLTSKDISEKAPDIEFSMNEQKKNKQKYEDLMKGISEELNLLRIKLKSGEYYILRDRYPALMTLIRKAIRHDLAGLNHSKQMQLEQALKSMDNKIKEASKHLESKNQNEARGSFIFVDEKVKKVFDEIQQKSSSSEVRKMELAGNVDDSIKKVEQALKNKDFKGAAELITLLQGSYDILPNEFNQKERKIKESLEKVREEFTHDQVDLAEKEMHKLTSEINHSLTKSKKFLEKGEVHKAILEFNHIKEQFGKIPKGFVNEKISIGRNILQVYREINTAQASALDTRFSNIAGQLTRVLDKVKPALDNNQYNEAIRLYNKAVGLFNSLPQIKEIIRSNFKSYLLILYEKLSSLKRKHVNREIQSKVLEIEDGIAICMRDIKKKEFEKAKKSYTELLEIYKSIPKSHTEVIIPIQERLFSLHTFFSEALEKENFSGFNKGIAIINSGLEKVDSLILQNRSEEAFMSFQRVMMLFNMLPRGSLKEKAKLRDELVKREEKVAFIVRKEVLGSENNEVEDLYHALLKYFALFSVYVEEAKFKEAAVDYHHMREVVVKLPYGIVSGSKVIKKELHLISTVVKAINLLIKLSKTRRKDIVRAELKSVLTEIPKGPYKSGIQKAEQEILHPKPKLSEIQKGFEKALYAAEQRFMPKQTTKAELPPEMVPKKKDKTTPIPLTPMTKEEEEKLQGIASRKNKSGHKRKPFTDLEEMLESDMVKTLDSLKKGKLVENKLKMASVFIEFGDRKRANELLGEVRAIDPKNSRLAKLEKLNEKET